MNEKVKLNEKVEKIALILGIPMLTVHGALRTPQPSLQEKLTKIEDIQTITQAIKMFEKLPEGHDLRKKAFTKWLSLCTATRQALAAYNKIENESEDDLKKLAGIKWASLCVTPNQAKGAWDVLKNDKETQCLMWKKWDELSMVEVKNAKTIFETKLALMYAPDKSDSEQAALEKLEEFSVLEAERATSEEEFRRIFNVAPPGSKAKEIIIFRLSKIL